MADEDREALFQRFLCAAVAACAYSIGDAKRTADNAFEVAEEMVRRYERHLKAGGV